MVAHKCYTCNDCGSSSSLSSEDCANTANTINSLYESLGISDGSNEPSNYCYTMTMGSTGEALNITIEIIHLTFDIISQATTMVLEARIVSPIQERIFNLGNSE